MMVTVIMVLALGVPLGVLGVALAVWLGRRLAGEREEARPEMTQPYIPDRGDKPNAMDQVQPGWMEQGSID